MISTKKNNKNECPVCEVICHDKEISWREPAENNGAGSIYCNCPSCGRFGISNMVYRKISSENKKRIASLLSKRKEKKLKGLYINEFGRSTHDSFDVISISELLANCE